jgi:hypothetical protein
MQPIFLGVEKALRTRGSVQERNFFQFLAALFLGPARFGVIFSLFRTSRVRCPA